jgi:hypothetical protein
VCAFYKATIESMARLSLRAVFRRHEKSFASFLIGETDKCETMLASLLNTVNYHDNESTDRISLSQFTRMESSS